jgi:hypothetical protein
MRMADRKKKSDSRNREDSYDSRNREDSYFAAGRRKRKRYMKIIVPVIIAVSAVAVISAIVFSIQPSNSNNYGPIGSAHEHAAFLVKLDGVPIDFSESKYQVKSRFIHVENNDGTTLHRHATDVPFIEFLNSVDMDIKNGCFVGDDGREYCDTADKRLRYFINGTESGSVSDYVANENDRILVIYGDENDNEIKQEIDALRQIPIQR